MRAAILPLGYYTTDQGPQGRGQYDGQRVYCGLSSASELFFFILTTQLYQYFSLFFFAICTI